MQRKRGRKDDTCLNLALKACRELMVAVETRPRAPNVSRALVLARYAIALRP